MRIKVVQDFIDILRCKKKFIINFNPYINGTNNKIIFKTGKKNVAKNIINKNLTISGNNNTVIFISDNIKFPKGLRLNIEGDNNYVEIHKPNFKETLIGIFYNDNRFILEETSQICNGATFSLACGGTIEIEKNCEIGNYSFWVVVNGDYKNKHKLHIGEGTHIAKDAIIRTSDGECLIDYETNMPISEPQDVYIGKHCWITSRCTILKGTYLPDNTIVGANSLVNKKFTKEYTLIAGTPAKVIKENVKWTTGAYGYNMSKYENQKP